jgi:hypothetical protein
MEMQQVLSNARLYILYYLSVNGILVNERGDLLDPLNRNFINILNTLCLDYKLAVIGFKQAQSELPPRSRVRIYPADTKDLNNALYELINKEKVTFRQNTIKLLSCEKEDISNIPKIVKAITGNNSEIDEAILCHWICTVKRKMQLKPVYNHIMPVLVGLQGCGKTKALNGLLMPLNEYILNLSLEQMSDTRYAQSLSDSYVALIDEMGGYARTELEALKSIITTDKITSRTLGSNRVDTMPQSCSFIGASNKPLDQLIIDSAMRRFWQFNCKQKMDWDVLNSIDYLSVWKGVDENKDYISKHISAIRAMQAEYSTRDHVSEFIIQQEILPQGDQETISVTSKFLYTSYRTWCFENGHQPLNNIQFGRRIGLLTLKSKVERVNGRIYNTYIVNKLNNISPSIFRVANE